MKGSVNELIDLERYPLHQPHSQPWQDLVSDCQKQLDNEGLFDLPELFTQGAISQTLPILEPLLENDAFVHERTHNIYFSNVDENLPQTHPARKLLQTSNRTLCADQLASTAVTKFYEWQPLATFLAAVMSKDKLYTMEDALARINVMAYHEGQALNWHFDRSEFTTTLLLQSPTSGGEFEYVKDLRTDNDANHARVSKVLSGEEAPTQLKQSPGSLNVFKGKNTAHRVTETRGKQDRIIAVFSFFEVPGVQFSEQERVGFYGRAN